MFHFSVGVKLVVRFKADHNTIPLENMTLSSDFYQLLLFLGYYILLGGLKLGYEVLDLSGVENFYGYIEDGEFI